MIAELYRYHFDESIPLVEIQSTLILAVLATESLHGEAQVRLDAAHYLDPTQRACVVDAHTDVGRDLNRLFVGFLRRELGAEQFRVERIEHAGAFAPAAVA
jgi:hypothetical protein